MFEPSDFKRYVCRFPRHKEKDLLPGTRQKGHIFIQLQILASRDAAAIGSRPKVQSPAPVPHINNGPKKNPTVVAPLSVLGTGQGII